MRGEGGSGLRALLKVGASEQEVSAVQALQGSHGLAPCLGVPEVLEIGTEEDGPRGGRGGKRFIVMEPLGEPLSLLAEHLAPVPPRVRWRGARVLGLLLLRRLRAVHGRGFVLGGLCPGAVLLGRAEGRSAHRVMPFLGGFGRARPYTWEPDFGNAADADDSLGPGAGSPETVDFGTARRTEGDRPAPRDDLESLGWLLCHIVFGGLPWSERTAAADWRDPRAQADTIAWVRAQKRQVLERGFSEHFGDRFAGCPPELAQYLICCREMEAHGVAVDYAALEAALAGAAAPKHVQWILALNFAGAREVFEAPELSDLAAFRDFVTGAPGAVRRYLTTGSAMVTWQMGDASATIHEVQPGRLVHTTGRSHTTAEEGTWLELPTPPCGGGGLWTQLTGPKIQEALLEPDFEHCPPLPRAAPTPAERDAPAEEPAPARSAAVYRVRLKSAAAWEAGDLDAAELVPNCLWGKESEKAERASEVGEEALPKEPRAEAAVGLAGSEAAPAPEPGVRASEELTEADDEAPAEEAPTPAAEPAESGRVQEPTPGGAAEEGRAVSSKLAEAEVPPAYPAASSRPPTPRGPGQFFEFGDLDEQEALVTRALPAAPAEEKAEDEDDEAEEEEAPLSMEEGAAVLVKGLRSKLKLNGQEGTLVECDASGRWTVLLKDGTTPKLLERFLELRPRPVPPPAGAESSPASGSEAPRPELLGLRSPALREPSAPPSPREPSPAAADDDGDGCEPQLIDRIAPARQDWAEDCGEDEAWEGKFSPYGRYYLVGSWDGWTKPLEMAWDGRAYRRRLRPPEGRAARFAVLLEADASLAFRPDSPAAHPGRLHAVLGPGRGGAGSAWALPRGAGVCEVVVPCPRGRPLCVSWRERPPLAAAEGEAAAGAPEAALETSVDPATGRVRHLSIGTCIGPWQVVGLLGMGREGGAVYLAQWPGTGINGLAAVKFPAEPAELRSLAQVQDLEGVPDLLDWGAVPGGVYLAMPVLIPSLEDVLAACDHGGAGGFMSWEAARGLGTGLVQALRGVHARGLVHRDIKPGNILLGPSGAPVVVDFGRAAPSLGARRDGAPADDLEAVGALLLHCLVGRGDRRGRTERGHLQHLRRQLADADADAEGGGRAGEGAAGCEYCPQELDFFLRSTRRLERSAGRLGFGVYEALVVHLQRDGRPWQRTVAACLSSVDAGHFVAWATVQNKVVWRCPMSWTRRDDMKPKGLLVRVTGQSKRDVRGERWLEVDPVWSPGAPGFLMQKSWVLVAERVHDGVQTLLAPVPRVARRRLQKLGRPGLGEGEAAG